MLLIRQLFTLFLHSRSTESGKRYLNLTVILTVISFGALYLSLRGYDPKGYHFTVFPRIVGDIPSTYGRY